MPKKGQKTLRWTDHNVALLADESIKAMEIAEILGVSRNAVEKARARLRKGEDLGRYTYELVPHMIGDRTLLARTCTNCGYFLDARCFKKTRNTKKVNSSFSYATECKWCLSKKTVERNRERKYPSQRKSRAGRYAPTWDTSRSGFAYTSEDLKICEDPSKTVVQKAVEMKRTWIAVQRMCGKNGFRSLNPQELGDKSEGQWQVKFLEVEQ